MIVFHIGVGEVFGHKLVDILMFPSPTAYVHVNIFQVIYIRLGYISHIPLKKM